MHSDRIVHSAIPMQCSLHIWLLALLVVSAQATDWCGSEGWSNATKDGEKNLCFKIITKDYFVSFSEAEQMCIKAGGFAAPMQDEEQEKSIQESLTMAFPSDYIIAGDTIRVYLGAKRVSKKEAGFIWTFDNSTIGGFQKWKKNLTLRNDCVMFRWNPSLSNVIVWRDVPCECKSEGHCEEKVRGVVCAKYESSAKPPPREPRCQDSSWSLSSSTVQDPNALCFKIVYFTVQKTITEARLLCKAVNAFPAPIRSEYDNKAIKENVELNTVAPPKINSALLFIGLHDVSPNVQSPADYRWMNDNSKLGHYQHWLKGEPTRGPAGPNEYERCVSISLAADLQWCDTRCIPPGDDITGIVCAKNPVYL